MVIGAVSFISSVALLILFAAKRGDGVHMAYAHMAIAAIAAIGFAVAFFRENAQMRADGAGKCAIAALAARYVSYVWVWATIALLTTYATGLEVWREWPVFTIACGSLAVLSMFFATMLQNDADAGREDPALLKAATILGTVLLGGMVITILGLLIDGKMTRFYNPRFTDWAANNVFFFGAIALASISGFALKFRRGE